MLLFIYIYVYAIYNIVYNGLGDAKFVERGLGVGGKRIDQGDS